MTLNNPPPTFFRRVQNGYAGCAVQLMNFVVLFVVVNLFVGFSFTASDKAQVTAAILETNPEGRPKATSLRTPHQLQYVDMKAYDGVPEDEVEQVLDDMTRLGNSGFKYEPWVTSGLPGFKSATVNTVEDGTEFTYRSSVLDDGIKSDPSWPIVDVYLFGGSTAFGTGVADKWTIGSCLWSELQQSAAAAHVRVRFFNYAAPGNYTSVEMLEFERLLRTDHHPQMAIFLDGLNDTLYLKSGNDLPSLSPRLAQVMETEQHSRRGTGLREYQWIPLVKFAYVMRQKFELRKEPVAAAAAPAAAAPSLDRSAAFVVRRYLENVDLARYLGRRYGVRCYFYWQPVPFVAYDHSLHRQFPTNYPPDSDDVYRRVYDTMRHADRDVVYLGDAIQQYGAGRKVFVDDCHYSPSFNRFLAQQMAAHVDLSEVQPKPPVP